MTQATAKPTASAFSLDPSDPLNDLRMSEKSRPLYEHVKRFIIETVNPMAVKYDKLSEGRSGAERWEYAPGQLDLLNGAKNQAKKEGLWNFFLPDADTGEGLSNLDYAYIAAELGKSPMASECMNCSAPDTGNMEVLERVGTPAQKEKWLKPLLSGEIRSDYASSDAKNIATTAVLEGNEWVINGEKHYISGAGSPRCKILITMVRSSPNAPPHQQQSMILIPKDTPGVKIIGPMHVFAEDHAPHGHMHIVFDNVRVPKDNMLLGEGRGFEISQVRLGPGRIHHCMRSIGAAERALELMCDRLQNRIAFGKALSQQSVWAERIADSRCMIDQARLLTLNAAHRMDVAGNKVAKAEIAMIKVVAPNMSCKVVDWAIQAFGAAGVSQDTWLAEAYAHQRTVRIVDGPDEVHRNAIAKIELGKRAPAKKAA